MADFPSGDGWWVMALAAGGAALAATNHLLSGLSYILGFSEKVEEKRRAESDERMRTAMRAELTVVRREIESDIAGDISEIRQHVSYVQKGVEGKQAVMEERLNSFYAEMRDRDEKLAESLHERISASMDKLEAKISRQVEGLGKQFSDALSAAMSGRTPRR